MNATNIDALLKGVKVFWSTDTEGNRLGKRYKVHSVLNRELWEKMENIWGRDWEIQMRDVGIGNDYEVGGCYATIPEDMWRDMVEQMKERLFIVRVATKQWNGRVCSCFWKVWSETRQAVIDDIDTDRPEVVDWEVLEAEHNYSNRYAGAESIYRELKQS